MLGIPPGGGMDDLARLPGARTHQSGNRRPASSPHGTLRGSSSCRPNGLDSARCLVFRRNSVGFEPSLLKPESPFPRKRNCQSFLDNVVARDQRHLIAELPRRITRERPVR